MIAVNIHATCIICATAAGAFEADADAGVLLLGPSGSGKSDLALRLIAMGARLVADDRCDIYFDGSAIRARAPRSISGMMEIRGVGIVPVPSANEARIALAVRTTGTSPRLPEHRKYAPPSALAVPDCLRPPEIEVDAFAASAPAKVLAAVAAFQRHVVDEALRT